MSTMTVPTPSGPPLENRSLQELMTAYARRAPVGSIAVIGNAPLAPCPERAAAIDSADLVVRMNSFVIDSGRTAPTQGSKVDVVVWNRITRATRFVFQAYRDRLYLLVEPMRMHGTPEVWPSSWPEDLGLVAVPNRSVTRPLNDLLGLPWRTERVAPTTGTMAAYLAVSLFPQADVLLTGYSFLDRPEQSSWFHQSGDSCPVGAEHRISLEASLLRHWVDRGRVAFHR